MTAHEHLNVRPARLHPYRRRARARTAKVRSNSDLPPQDTSPNMQNKPAFHSAPDVRAAETVTVRPSGSPTSHLAPIEIP
jgi:hypothetical protein